MASGKFGSVGKVESVTCFFCIKLIRNNEFDIRKKSFRPSLCLTETLTNIFYLDNNMPFQQIILLSSLNE